MLIICTRITTTTTTREPIEVLRVENCFLHVTLHGDFRPTKSNDPTHNGLLCILKTRKQPQSIQPPSSKHTERRGVKNRINGIHKFASIGKTTLSLRSGLRACRRKFKISFLTLGVIYHLVIGAQN